MTKATIEQEVVRTETEDLFICDDCSREVDEEGTALEETPNFDHAARHYCSECWNDAEGIEPPGMVQRASEWATKRYVEPLDLVEGSEGVGPIEFCFMVVIVGIFLPLILPIVLVEAATGDEEAKFVLLFILGAAPWGFLAVHFALEAGWLVVP